MRELEIFEDLIRNLVITEGIDSRDNNFVKTVVVNSNPFYALRVCYSDPMEIKYTTVGDKGHLVGGLLTVKEVIKLLKLRNFK